MVTTAVAILNYNGKNFLRKFLPAVIQYSNSVPMYVGDNASTDGSVEMLRSEFPTVNIIRLAKNNGYSKGYNLLIKEITADYVALINSDIEVTNNWLTPLIKVLDTDKLVAAVQPKIKSYAHKNSFEYAGGAGGFIDSYGYPFCRGRLFDTLEEDTGQYDNDIEVTWASGACFLVRKSAFDEVSGFDDDFFAHMEEIDLCWRLANRNFTIKYTSKSTVYHVGGGTLSYESPFKTYLNFRNGLYMLIKNVPMQQRSRVIAIRVLLDWASAFYFLLQGKGTQFFAVFKAHIKVLRTYRSFYKKRFSNPSDKSILKPYSIVWKYFIKGKRTFDEVENSKGNN